MTKATEKLPGVPGAVLLGLGSMVGTGVFVTIAIASGTAGNAVLAAIVVAALAAWCNATSAAQLAAAHPVSGGTYEYAYRFLNPAAGFTAGWLFVCAKTASGAAASLGASAYLLRFLGVGDRWLVPVAVLLLAIFGVLAWRGVHRSLQATAVLLAISVASLGWFVLAGAQAPSVPVTDSWLPGQQELPGFFQAAALVFVAFTGYGRIATLAEEVRDPARTIPRAIGWTVVLVALLYLAVAWAGVRSVGAAAFARGTAPLESAARMLGNPLLAGALAWGACAAMLGVLLNLLLGVSRVLMAMGRRGDLPGALAHLDPQTQTPARAVILTGLLMLLLALRGDFRAVWSFSAVTVLLYYAITNVAALRLPVEHRKRPRVVSVLGLMLCLGLAPFVESAAWVLAAILLSVGWGVRTLARRKAPAITSAG